MLDTNETLGQASNLNQVGTLRSKRSEARGKRQFGMSGENCEWFGV